MPYPIRSAVPEDAEAITMILRDLGWFEYMRNEPFDITYRRIQEHLARCLNSADHSVYVAVDPQDQVAGYTSVHWLPYFILAGPEGYISELFIRGPDRGQGLGAQLLAAVATEAKERGCVRLSLLNNRERESYAQGYYTKQGWQERPVMVNFVFPCT
ncbi:MAG: GNAT family N-acetyltransferase [Anaerolineae bacterium]|nr:GNAT family N-acetyltransferase [Anaerolineae bacterium]